MIEIPNTDLWKAPERFAEWDKPLWVVVPTNGETKANGEAVMGAGVAREAARRFPALPKLLGSALRREGNKVYLWHFDTSFVLVTFPTKDEWSKRSSTDLIVASAHKLVELAIEHGAKTVVLPRVGTGCGGLGWAVVKSRIQDVLLDDVDTQLWFVVVSK